MSQWNNSYSYNNQYQQNTNGWNGDPNGQYMNQAQYYTRPDANGQYVTFNEFLTQMQNSNVAPQTIPNTFNNTPGENYPPGQYNYQNAPSSSQTHLNNYNYGPSSISNAQRGGGAAAPPGEANTYPVNPQSQFGVQPGQLEAYTNNMTFKSNLTATAVEFVPKGTPKPSTSSQNIPESLSSYNDVNESGNETRTNHGSSSERNWRQRPQSSHQNSDVKDSEDINKSNERNGRNRDTAQRNNKANGRHESREYSNDGNLSTHGNESNRNQDSMNMSQDTSPQVESNSLSREPHQRNYDSNNRNQESRSKNKNQESRSNNKNQESRQHNDRNQETRQKNYDDRNSETRQNNYDPNTRNKDARHNYDSIDRGQESREYDTNQRYDSRNDRRNQSKGNPKLKGKDDNRTFYNSAISKDSQDVRSGRGESSRAEGYAKTEGSWGEGSRDGYAKTEGSRGDGYARNEGPREGSGRGQRNWAGTQRPRGDRNQDDEQYANNYQKEDRVDRDRPERIERDRGYDRGERDRGYDRERGYDRQDRERPLKSNLSSPARFKSKHQTDPGKFYFVIKYKLITAQRSHNMIVLIPH